MTVLHVSIPNTKRDYFDYLALPDSLPAVGARVWVSFRNKERLGVVVGLGTPDDAKRKLKSITEVIDEAPLFSEELLKLCHWISRYYHAPLSEVLAIALPKKLRTGHTIEPKLPKENTKPSSTPLILNPEQAVALDAISHALNQYHAFVLHGVTGSGKTEVYLQLATRVLADNKQVLILVPEIGLTPQLFTRFEARFREPIVMIHSHVSDKNEQKPGNLHARASPNL